MTKASKEEARMLSRGLALLLAAILLAACTTTQQKFAENPTATRDIQLCRTYLETTEVTFRAQLEREVARRGFTEESCRDKVLAATVGITALAVIGTTAAVAAACSDGGCAGGGGGFASAVPSNDYDCYGGSGDGPNWVFYERYVGPNDPYDLDRDNDGIGCEANDIYGGA